MIVSKKDFLVHQCSFNTNLFNRFVVPWNWEISRMSMFQNSDIDFRFDELLPLRLNETKKWKLTELKSSLQDWPFGIINVCDLCLIVEWLFSIFIFQMNTKRKDKKERCVKMKVVIHFFSFSSLFASLHRYACVLIFCLSRNSWLFFWDTLIVRWVLTRMI